MPYYDYKCPSCELTIELERKMNDTSTVSCGCGDFMEKQISKPMIVFNGAGWQTNEVKGN